MTSIFEARPVFHPKTIGLFVAPLGVCALALAAISGVNGQSSSVARFDADPVIVASPVPSAPRIIEGATPFPVATTGVQSGADSTVFVVPAAKPAAETRGMPSVLENELRQATETVAAQNDEVNGNSTVKISVGSEQQVASLPDVVAPIPANPPEFRVNSSDARQSNVVVNGQTIVSHQSHSTATVTIEETMTFVSPEDIIPPDPMGASQRPPVSVTPRDVMIITPARTVSVDPMLANSFDGNWPRRLDQINARQSVEAYVHEQIDPDQIFSSDWVEVTDEFGTRLLPRTLVGR